MQTDSDFLQKHHRYILFVLIVLGAILRIYHINFQSLWVDEMFTIIPTDPEKSVWSVIEYSKADQPPLFFIYVHFIFKVFGYNEFVGRLASAVIGIVSIPAIYFLGKECSDRSGGLLAALLVTVNYFNIYYSQELRFYSLAFLMAVMSYLFFIRAFKSNRSADFIGYVVFTIGLLYTHYYGMIIFFTQGFTFLILLWYKRDIKFIVHAVVSGVLILAAFSFWLPIVFGDLSFVAPHIKMPSSFYPFQYYYYYLGKDALSAIILGFLIILFFLGVIKKRGRLESAFPVYITIVFWLIISYLIPYLRSVWVTPMVVDRYTIVTQPAWIIMAVIGWGFIKQQRLKNALFALLFLSAIGNLFFFRNYYTRVKKEQWREAGEYVIVRNRMHYPVYSSLPWHFNYYFRDEKQKVKDVSELANGKELRIWFIQAHFTEEEMQARLNEVKEHYIVIDQKFFFGAEAVLLERR